MRRWACSCGREGLVSEGLRACPCGTPLRVDTKGVSIDAPRCEHRHARVHGGRAIEGDAVNWCYQCGALRRQLHTPAWREWIDRFADNNHASAEVALSYPEPERFEWGPWIEPHFGVRP